MNRTESVGDFMDAAGGGEGFESAIALFIATSGRNHFEPAPDFALVVP